MIGQNPLRTKVLITTDEVQFHAPTDSAIDVRVILQSIIIAERRFIKPLIGKTVYEGLINAKNRLVTSANKADMQTAINAGRGSDREPIVLVEGDYVNSDTYLDTKQLALWQEHLHKLTAECVWYCSLPVNRARFTAKGVVKNFPETISQEQESVTIDLKDLKHLLDAGLFTRVSPLIEDLHRYMCDTGYPSYDRDCDCDLKGSPFKNRSGVYFGLYDDDRDCDCKGEYS
jgi:hypothetical protein